jgi:RNA polymerase sigma factor for flagellar operon FliA
MSQSIQAKKRMDAESPSKANSSAHAPVAGAVEALAATRNLVLTPAREAANTAPHVLMEGVASSGRAANDIRRPLPTRKRRDRPNPVAYLDFVRKIASRMARNLPSHVALDDLVGAGILGLIDAMERYDPEKAERFETFAEFRVKGAILDELRRYDIMARNARLKSKRLARKTQELTAVLGRPPSDVEMAKSLELTIEDYRTLVNRVGHVRVLSLDDLAADQEATNEKQLQLSAPGIAPDEMSSMRELQEHLTQAISGLPERQQKILDMYYRREMTLKQIGVEVGVTESRVCQIMGEATTRLRNLLRSEARRG